VQTWTPQVRLVVHTWGEEDPDEPVVSHVEGHGPVFTAQLADLLKGAQVKAARAVHIGGAGIGVDSYEIPDRIRREVVWRDRYDRFPWSSIEAGHLDLDHTEPYRPGGTGQTRPGNLAPLSRRAHRVKTVAGWQLEQPHPGRVIWTTGAGQIVEVDNTGTHRLPPQRE